ncbi:MAG: hypothetical protein ABRQ25_02135 [Clostridiaceae bacterium]
MRIDGTIIKEEGVTFAVVEVHPKNMRNHIDANEEKRKVAKFFPDMPIVLMSKESEDVPTYYGRPDIVNVLKKVYPSRVPLVKFTFS